MTSNGYAYDRELDLKQRVNTFLTESFDLPQKDYYSLLTVKDILHLKSILSDINNIMTLKLTLRFVEWACDYLGANKESKDLALAQVTSTKPNANGYDVIITNPPVVAEVKCNIPINKGNRYGSAQRFGIMKDINNLVEGKSRTGVPIDNYHKFLVLLNTPEVKDATYALLQADDRVEFIDQSRRLPPKDIVSVVFIEN